MANMFEVILLLQAFIRRFERLCATDCASSQPLGIVELRNAHPSSDRSRTVIAQ